MIPVWPERASTAASRGEEGVGAGGETSDFKGSEARVGS